MLSLSYWHFTRALDIISTGTLSFISSERQSKWDIAVDVIFVPTLCLSWITITSWGQGRALHCCSGQMDDRRICWLVPGLQLKIETKKLEIHMQPFLLPSPVPPSTLQCFDSLPGTVILPNQKPPQSLSGKFHLYVLRSMQNLSRNKWDSIFF